MQNPDPRTDHLVRMREALDAMKRHFMIMAIASALGCLTALILIAIAVRDLLR